MPLAPKLPERILFERISTRPGGPGERLPFALVGFRPPERGDWYASGAIPQAYLASAPIPTPYWIVRPILNDSQRARFGIADWMNVAPPLTVWLVRDGRRAIRVFNPDRRYIGEFLIDSPLGRACLCAALVQLSSAGYRIARQDTGESVDPNDRDLKGLR